jgi:hypothetical protein
MKGKRIVNLRTHIGITQFAGQQTLEAAKMIKPTFELTAIGVYVKATNTASKTFEVLIPFSNITHIELVDDVDAAKEAKAK